MIYNLFIVKSPLQLINAVEATSHFNLKNNILVLLNDGSLNNNLQMEKLLSWNKWIKIFKVGNEKKSRFFKYIKLIRELQKINYNYIFFGEFGSIHKAILANTTKEKVFYIDDGLGTYEDYNQYIKPNKLNKYNFKELRFLFFGLKVKINDIINLFTYYDLELSKGELVKNDLKSLKQNYLGYLNKTNDIYILGQPLESFIPNELYIKFINGILLKYQSKKIIYMPHRGESQEQINNIKKMQTNLFEYRENQVPIELYFLEQNILPEMVISFFSTALSTLEIIYDIPFIYSMEIPRETSVNLEIYDSFLINYYKNLDDNKILKFKELGL